MTEKNTTTIYNLSLKNDALANSLSKGIGVDSEGIHIKS